MSNGNVKFELNKKGLIELLKSQPVLDHVNLVAETIAEQAGEGYVVEKAHPIKYTSIASVETGTFKARLDNSKNNTLEKAVSTTGCERRPR